MTGYATSQADLNGDGTVNLADAGLMASAWLADDESAQYVAGYDLTGDGVINNADSDIIAANYGSNGRLCRSYFHFDGLGSVVALADDAGNIVETYQYDAYSQTQTVLFR